MTETIKSAEELNQLNTIFDFYTVYYQIKNNINDFRKYPVAISEDRFRELENRLYKIVYNLVENKIEGKKDATLGKDPLTLFLDTITYYDTPRNKQYLEFGKLGVKYWNNI